MRNPFKICSGVMRPSMRPIATSSSDDDPNSIAQWLAWQGVNDSTQIKYASIKGKTTSMIELSTLDSVTNKKTLGGNEADHLETVNNLLWFSCAFPLIRLPPEVKKPTDWTKLFPLPIKPSSIDSGYVSRSDRGNNSGVTGDSGSDSTHSTELDKECVCVSLPELDWAHKTFGPNDNPIGIPFGIPKILIPFRLKIRVYTIEALVEFLDLLENLRDFIAELFLDGEGSNYGRDGTLSVLTVSLACVSGVAWLLDITTLGTAAFDTPNTVGTTLRMILENPRIPKVWFDVRQDNAALHAIYGVEMKYAIDLQIMAMLSFLVRSTHLWGLDKCIVNHLRLGGKELSERIGAKQAGKRYFPKGDYSKWDDRPLPAVLEDYAAGDTVYMSHLYARELAILRQHPNLMAVALKVSDERVVENQAKDFKSSGGLTPKALSNLRVDNLSPGKR